MPRHDRQQQTQLATRKHGQRAAETPPHSPEAESAVIGSVLLDNSVYRLIEPKLKPSDFHDIRHQMAWEVIASRLDNGKPVDTIIVIDELRSKGKLDWFDNDYFITVLQSVGAPSNCNFYAQIVRRDGYIREVIALAHELLRVAYNQQLNGNSQILIEVLRSAVNGV